MAFCLLGLIKNWGFFVKKVAYMLALAFFSRWQEIPLNPARNCKPALDLSCCFRKV